jgi:hypothetical protein
LADFSITITNAIRTWGPAPSMRWGTDSWGAKWGSGTEDTTVKAQKLIGNSIGSDSSVQLVAGFNRTIANTLDFVEDLSSETITVAGGYTLVYPGGSTNAEDRIISTYSAAQAASITYSSSSAGSTTWS